MPYIDQTPRGRITSTGVPTTAGELNYAITKLIIRYLDWQETHSQGRGYQQFNDVIGALEGAKLEFYRRVVVPYEDDKIKQNGDVY